MSYIARVYADLIRKGKKTIEDVREELKNEVRQLLEAVAVAVVTG